MPLYLKNKEPDGINGKSEKIWNKAYVSPENTNESLENSFKKSINALSQKKIKLFFVYPIPEFNVHVPKTL